MRALITVLIIFLALCLTMIFNYLYINSTSDELTKLAESLSLDDSDCLEKINELEEKWEKSYLIFSLTVSFKDLDYLGETLLALKSSAESTNALEFVRYQVLFIDAIDGVRRLERFSIINIL